MEPGTADRSRTIYRWSSSGLTWLGTAVTQVQRHLPAIGGFLVPFALVLGLGLESGGYDIVVRSQVAIVVWWVVLLCVGLGLVPLIRVTRHGWMMLAVLGAYLAWTLFATVFWTDSTERSVIETSRVMAIFGFLFLLLLFQGKDGMRRSLGGLGAAVVVIAVVALASRYHPGWFDLGEMPEGYPAARLNYPLGYWNGLAALMAIGLPALMWAATEARSMVTRALAAGAIPLVILTTVMTASRGGVGAMAIAIVLLIVVYPHRLKLFGSQVVPAAGSVLLIGLLNRYPELRDNLGGIAGQQGVEMTWLTIGIVIVTGVIAGLLQSRIFPRIGIPEVPRGVTKLVGYVVAGLGVAAILVLFASGTISDRWEEFKQPVTHDPTVERLSSLASGERYQNWNTAIEAGRDAPLTGSGPGTFEYLWSQNGEGEIFVRDAHSLYLEAFGEAGLPGLILVLGLVLIPVGLALRAAVLQRVGERRARFAAAASGMTAFAVGAAVDWSWEMTVLVAAFLVYVAAVCGPDASIAGGRANRRSFCLPLLNSARVWVVAGSVLAIVVIYVPMLGTKQVRESQSLYRAGEVTASLAKAEDARGTNPWSASAAIQVALVQVALDDGDAAVAAARDATDLDPQSWKAWQVLAQAAEFDNQPDLASEAESRVRELNRNFDAEEAG